MRILDAGNPILKKASNLAGGLIANRSRVAILLTSIGKKLNEVEDKKKLGQDLKEKITLFARLLRVTGDYEYG